MPAQLAHTDAEAHSFSGRRAVLAGSHGAGLYLHGRTFWCREAYLHILHDFVQIKHQYSIATVTVMYELHRNKSLILTLTPLTLNPIYC